MKKRNLNILINNIKNIIKMLSEIKYLENVNNFPNVGLMYFENSGENLLRLYLERIFRIKTGTNIKNEFFDKEKLFQQNEHIELKWIIASDYPQRNPQEYTSANISSAILLIRNPVDLIMSKILRDSYFLEEALNKIDQMIEVWKEFYKFWVNAPIPVHIIRYEDLIDEPQEILKQLTKFILGIKNIENSKLEYILKVISHEKIDKHFLAYDVEVREDNHTLLNQESIQKIQHKFYLKLDKLLKKFNYEVSTIAPSFNWLAEFNKDNFVKSVEFHDFLNNQFLTSSYYTINIG